MQSLYETVRDMGVPDARIRFEHDWLRRDLDLMKDGIQSHIDAPRAQPRSFPPLRGDYRR